MVSAIGHGQMPQPAFARFGGGVRGADGGGKQDWKAEGHEDHGHHHGRAHGVLRNLQAGHYQGAAGLRLSVNFSAEIQAQAVEAESAATAEAAASFKNQATKIVDDFIDGLDESAFDMEAVNTAAEDFFAAVDQLGETATTLEGLQSRLSEAVEAFGAALNQAIAGAPPAETLDDTGGPEPTSVPEIADVTDVPPAGETTGTDPVDARDDLAAAGAPDAVSEPEDPFERLALLIEDLTASLLELAQSILTDAGASLDSLSFSFEASVVTVTSSRASTTYSQVSLTFDASSGDSSGLEVAA